MFKESRTTPQQKSTSYDCQRFVFHQGVLEASRPLQKSKGKFHQSREDFLQYCRDLDVYLRNLVNEIQDRECPFCTLSLNNRQNAYTNDQRAYPFVDHRAQHSKLWEEGLIVLPNYEGWHSVSELVIPRKHFAILDYEQEYFNAALDMCFRRWQTHRSHLTKILPRKINKKLIHGIVCNQRVGQSISHSHFHCYSSLHLLEEMPRWLRMPVIHTTQSQPPFRIHLSEDDHPDIIAICQLKERDVHDIEVIEKALRDLLAVSKLVSNVSFALYERSVPCSVGWFFVPYPSPCLIYAFIPLKRHGTLQSFQGDRFHKFSPNVIRASIRKLIDDLR
jgi:hypothetical protein